MLMGRPQPGQAVVTTSSCCCAVAGGRRVLRGIRGFLLSVLLFIPGGPLATSPVEFATLVFFLRGVRHFRKNFALLCGQASGSGWTPLGGGRHPRRVTTRLAPSAVGGRWLGERASHRAARHPAGSVSRQPRSLPCPEAQPHLKEVSS